MARAARPSSERRTIGDRAFWDETAEDADRETLLGVGVFSPDEEHADSGQYEQTREEIGRPWNQSHGPLFNQSISKFMIFIEEIVAHIVVQRHGNQDEIGTILDTLSHKIGELIIGTPPAHTGIDDLDWSSCRLPQPLFQHAHKGIFELNLIRLHKRIPKDEDPIHPW